MILYNADARKPGYNYRNGLFLQDDFASGTNASGGIGQLGWFAAGTLSQPTSPTGRVGIITLDTGASSGTQTRITLFPAGVGVFDPVSSFALTFIARLNSNDADTLVRYGAGNSVASNPPVNGIYFEKLAADTNWFCVTRAASSQTRTDTGIAVTTDFCVFSCFGFGTSIEFYLNGVRVAINTGTIPSTFISPMAWMINSAAAAKTLDVDYFEFTGRGIAR